MIRFENPWLLTFFIIIPLLMILEAGYRMQNTKKTLRNTTPFIHIRKRCGTIWSFCPFESALLLPSRIC